jgi:hypothetical protein
MKSKSENRRSPEREEQRRRSVGEGNPNLGSNCNAEGKREVSNRERVSHVAVEAHGVSAPEFTKDQTRRQHEQGVFESKGESGKREAKSSSVTLGRHVSSRSGAEVSTDRKDFLKSVRAKREKEAFGS